MKVIDPQLAKLYIRLERALSWKAIYSPNRASEDPANYGFGRKLLTRYRLTLTN
jgi:hypothetical protein